MALPAAASLAQFLRPKTEAGINTKKAERFLAKVEVEMVIGINSGRQQETDAQLAGFVRHQRLIAEKKREFERAEQEFEQRHFERLLLPPKLMPSYQRVVERQGRKTRALREEQEELQQALLEQQQDSLQASQRKVEQTVSGTVGAAEAKSGGAAGPRAAGGARALAGGGGSDTGAGGSATVAASSHSGADSVGPGSAQPTVRGAHTASHLPDLRSLRACDVRASPLERISFPRELLKDGSERYLRVYAGKPLSHFDRSEQVKFFPPYVPKPRQHTDDDSTASVAVASQSSATSAAPASTTGASVSTPPAPSPVPLPETPPASGSGGTGGGAGAGGGGGGPGSGRKSMAALKWDAGLQKARVLAVAEKIQGPSLSKQAAQIGTAQANADALNLQIHQFLSKRVDQKTGQYSIKRFRRRLRMESPAIGTGSKPGLAAPTPAAAASGERADGDAPVLRHAPREPGAFYMFWHTQYDEVAKTLQKRLTHRLERRRDMTDAGFHSPRMMSSASRHVQRNLEAVRDRTGTPIPMPPSPVRLPPRAASTLPSLRPTPSPELRRTSASSPPRGELEFGGTAVLSARQTPAKSVWKAALDEVLQDKSSLAARRVFWSKLCRAMDESGQGTLLELNLIEHIRQCLIQGCGVDASFFLNLFEHVATMGLHMLKNPRISAILHIVRGQVGVSAKQFAALVPCLKATRGSHPGEIMFKLDTELLVERFVRRADRFGSGEGASESRRASIVPGGLLPAASPYLERLPSVPSPSDSLTRSGSLADISGTRESVMELRAAVVERAMADGVPLTVFGRRGSVIGFAGRSGGNGGDFGGGGGP